MNDANKLFEAALQKVESKSIREWAQSDHNRPLWLEYCRTAKYEYTRPGILAPYIVALAIGL
jgi:hypothetical protein